MKSMNGCQRKRSPFFHVSWRCLLTKTYKLQVHTVTNKFNKAVCLGFNTHTILINKEGHPRDIVLHLATSCFLKIAPALVSHKTVLNRHSVVPTAALSAAVLWSPPTILPQRTAPLSSIFAACGSVQQPLPLPDELMQPSEAALLTFLDKGFR